MRPGLTLSIMLSILLIGGAVLYRFTEQKKIQPVLSITTDSASNTFDIQDLVALNASSTTYAAIPSSVDSVLEVSNSDLLGRGLLADYLDLTQKGGVTASNLNAIADQYVQIVPELVQAQNISLNDLKLTSNDKDDVLNYSIKLFALISDYEKRISAVYGEMVGKSYEAIGKTAPIYAEAASSLKEMGVPPVLASAHAKLVNAVLMNAVASKAVENMDIDPATGLAGILAMNENLNKETEALEAIKITLGLTK